MQLRLLDLTESIQPCALVATLENLLCINLCAFIALQLRMGAYGNTVVWRVRWSSGVTTDHELGLELEEPELAVSAQLVCWFRLYLCERCMECMWYDH